MARNRSLRRSAFGPFGIVHVVPPDHEAQATCNHSGQSCLIKGTMRRKRDMQTARIHSIVAIAKLAMAILSGSAFVVSSPADPQWNTLSPCMSGNSTSGS